MSLSDPNAASQSAPPASGKPQTIKLNRGEILFSEGENSRAMFLVKSGSIRVFKKKGDAFIEIDTVRAGQILGELAFLDGLPRSASCEAISSCELQEVSGPVFEAVLAKIPDWFKILLKTVVGRLRTAGTRIRQLEQASTAYDYSEKDGKRTASYAFFTPYEILKVSSALLLVTARHGTRLGETNRIETRVGLLQRYANQIMGVPVAKITTLVDIFSQVGICSFDDGAATLVIEDVDFLEKTISYLNEENLLETSKRHDISNRGFLLMSLIAKHLPGTSTDAAGMATVNLAEIRKIEAETLGKDPFRMEDASELVKLGYIASLSVKSADEVITSVKVDTFSHAARLQRVVKMIEATNDEKRKGAR